MDRKIDKSEALDFVEEVADGLGALHDAGGVHRDLKPGNLFVLDSQSALRIRIIDLGLAQLVGRQRVTSSEDTLGTIDYSSPEQIKSAKDSDCTLRANIE